MTQVIDFHTHVFSSPLKQLPDIRVPYSLSGILSSDRLQSIRKQARNWAKPLVGSLHQVQTSLRYLPKFTRKNLDELCGLVPLPGLLLESTATDLMAAMDEANVDTALVIAHPPVISNEFILDLCELEPRLIPVVNVPKAVSDPVKTLQGYIRLGAKVLKIHPAADGEGPDSLRYQKLLKEVADQGIPVILHTGCIHSHFFYKDPSQGQVERFAKWFEAYPQISFVLAHMNFHDPEIALDLCEQYENLFVDTSWQPAESIGEAVRRIGAERVLFGTDWPIVGNNMSVGRKRIEECIEIGLFNQEQAELILGENANKLLGLE
jgi:predicted TIM-barrel fold metal-dependent hydrolase